MGLGGKQPRFPGKTPRFPGKQPRRMVPSESEDEEQDADRSAEEVKDTVLHSEDDADMQLADEGDDEDEDYEEEDEDEEEQEDGEKVDRYGFLKGTEYTQKPSHYDSKRIDELVLLLPQQEREKIAALKGVKLEERIGQIHDKYKDGYEYHRMERMRKLTETHNQEKREARKPREQKAKAKKKEALQQFMQSKRASETADKKRASRDMEDEDFDDMDAYDEPDDLDDDDEDYEDSRYKRNIARRAKQKRGARDSNVRDELDAQIMEAIVSDDEEQDASDRMDTSTYMYEEEEDSEPATLEDINKARVPRAWLAKYLHEPYLVELVKGAFLRVIVGNTKGSKGVGIYRIARVRGVVDYKRMYDFDLDGKGNTIRTNKMLEVAVHHDGNIRRVDLNKLSNKQLTEREFEEYKKELGTYGEDGVSATEARHIADRLRTLPKKFSYKASDVQESIASRGVEMGGHSSMRRINEIEKELNSLRGELREKKATLDRARQAVKDSSYDELEPAPAEAENLRVAEEAYKSVSARVVVARKRHKSLIENEQKRAQRAQQFGGGLDSINQRNELENVNTILQSGERKRRAARAALAPSKQFESAAGSRGSRGSPSKKPKARKTTFDPFKRRLTRPTILWATKKEVDEKKEEEKSAPVAKIRPQATAAPVKEAPLSASKPRVADLETLMCDAVTPEDMDFALDSTDDSNSGSSHLRRAAHAIRLPWPLPTVDPTQPAVPLPSRDGKPAGNENKGSIHKNFFLLNELECAERYLLQHGRRYRAIKMYLNMHRWTEALELAKGEDAEHLDLVLARRLAFLERTNTTEDLPGFKNLASRASQLDIDAVKVATEQLDEKDRKMNAVARTASGALVVYTLDEYHARRDEQG